MNGQITNFCGEWVEDLPLDIRMAIVQQDFSGACAAIKQRNDRIRRAKYAAIERRASLLEMG